MREGQKERKRLVGPDFLRGLAIVGMIFYHFYFDLVVFLWRDDTLLSLPWARGFQILVAALFIFTAGLSHGLSKNLCRHALRLAFFALLLTGLSFFLPTEPIYFGILHFMAVAGLAGMWVSRPFCEKYRRGLLLSFLITLPFFPSNLEGSGWLGILLGLPSPSFRSGDYFPLLPWIFLYGAGRGYLSKFRDVDRLFPRYAPLVWLGQRSLWVYFLHQPLLYALVWIWL